MKIVATCIPWVESILKKEIEKISWKILESKDRMIVFEWNEYDLVQINLWSRVANRVYIELANFKVNDFDYLFDNISKIKWQEIVWKNRPIIVNGVSIKSKLTSIPSIQKITKKAIITSITNRKNEFYFEDDNLNSRDILVFIENDNCRVLLNTSWEALHKRGYRKNEHEASIKESLAASLVLLSWWKFGEPLYDFFCWSWTILIEALLIAKNIAPWTLWRRFAFEDFDFISKDFFTKAKLEAKSKIFDKQFIIFWSDIFDENIQLSRQNIQKAWFNDEEIKLQKKDFKEFLKWDKLVWTLVSNPPYGIRLDNFDLNSIYTNLIKIFNTSPDLWWWFITSFESVDLLIKQNDWKKRKLYNWNEKCYFYKKIN